MDLTRTFIISSTVWSQSPHKVKGSEGDHRQHQNKETSVDLNFSCFSPNALTRIHWRPKRDGMHGKENKITVAFATDDVLIHFVWSLSTAQVFTC